jgi:hypothetical protein
MNRVPLIRLKRLIVIVSNFKYDICKKESAPGSQWLNKLILKLQKIKVDVPLSKILIESCYCCIIFNKIQMKLSEFYNVISRVCTFHFKTITLLKSSQSEIHILIARKETYLFIYILSIIVIVET